MFWNRPKKTKQQETENNPKCPSLYRKETTVSLSLKDLKQLVPIGKLPYKTLKNLNITQTQHNPGDVIFDQTSSANRLSYIIKGKCYIELSKGTGFKIEASTFQACYPLSGDAQYPCKAYAKTFVTLIHLPKSCLKESAQIQQNPLLRNEDIPDTLLDNSFFNAFCQHFKQDKLTIPSLPDVAVKLRAAVQKEIGIKEAVKIINLDPAISTKLIQIVNSPLYRTLNPISNSHDAVSRLGLTTTRNLVTSISIQNLFSSKNKLLLHKAHGLWQQGIKVSSLAHTLATLSNRRINPDEALLAGLIHNIGALPIIVFADSINIEKYSIHDIDLCMGFLQGLLGQLILEKWGFPKQLIAIPRHIENWYFSDSDQLELTDIILLAKFHSYIGSKQMQRLPLIYTLPAFQKLENHALTPDMSLKTLHDAKQQIAEAMKLFGN